MERKGTVWIAGASSGLGLAVANAFAQGGWLVIGGARSFGCENEQRPSQNGRFLQLPLDVTREDSCQSFARQALEISPQVDVLVCAAALLVLGSCESTSVAELQRVLDTNVLGTARMLKLALPIMRRQHSGKVILFSSINGLLGIPFQSAYTASKHALEGYAECLSMEASPYGIQVCLVEPGDHRGGSQRTRLHASGEIADSPYRGAYENACAAIRRDEANGLSPDRLGRLVEKNARRKHMRFRLRVAKPDQHLAVWLHRLLPPWANRRILCAYYMGRSKNF